MGEARTASELTVNDFLYLVSDFLDSDLNTYEQATECSAFYDCIRDYTENCEYSLSEIEMKNLELACEAIRYLLHPALEALE